MFARLKISSRIILIALGLLIISLSLGLFYMKSFTQIAPNAYEREQAERIFYFDKLKSIEVNRGFWNIDLIPSDSNFIKINGGMKILNYHLISDQTDTGINFDLSDSIKDDYLYEFDAMVYTNSLKNIHLESFANMRIDTAQFYKLNVSLKDESKLQMKDCQIEELKLNSYNLSTFETESCSFGNISSSMYDSSFAIIYSADNINAKVQEDFSVLMTYDDINEYSTNVSDSLHLLSNFMPEYFDSLKWLMLFDTVLRYSGKYEYNIINANYNPQGISSKPELSEERHFAGFFPSFENGQLIYFENLLFMDQVEVNVSLVFSRGIFNSINYTTYNVSDSLHKLIVDVLNEKYGACQAEQSEPFYFQFNDGNVTHVWHDYKGRIGEKFTKIVLRRTGNQIIIEINGPYITFEDDMAKRIRARYYFWPYFVM